jgi:hypothetical protein
MSGRKISDHSFWAGSSSKESPMPMNSKMKQESSAMGGGELGRYEDTTETIKAQQEMNVRKAKSQPQKAGHRY